MLRMSEKYQAGNDFEASARKAISDFYVESGRLPQAILTVPGTTELSVVSIEASRGGHPVTYQVPVRAEVYHRNFQGMGVGEFIMDCTDPTSTLESCSP